MNPTHIFKYPGADFMLEWHKPSGKYRLKHRAGLGSWSPRGYTQEEIESNGWKCHPISLENK